MFILAGRKAQFASALKELVADIMRHIENDLQGIRSVADLSARVKELRTQVETLEIEKARKTEEFERRDREIEHKVGLERKRQEFELDAAKREAILSVGEKNLEADRKRFEEQMAFVEKRFTEQVDYLKGIIGQLSERLPSMDIHAEMDRGKRAVGK